MDSKPDEVVRIRTVRKKKMVELETDEKGTHVRCILKELDGPGLSEWFGLQAERVIVDENGKPTGMKPMPDMHEKLISMCLFDEEGNTIAPSFIRTWSSSAQQTLFDMAAKMSGLNSDSRDAEKK